MGALMERCRERMRRTDLGSLPEAQGWLKEQLGHLKAELQVYKEAFRATRIQVSPHTQQKTTAKTHGGQTRSSRGRRRLARCGESWELV